eukprot:1282832-Pyramimonas_sp.AAC.1
MTRVRSEETSRERWAQQGLAEKGGATLTATRWGRGGQIKFWRAPKRNGRFAHTLGSTPKATKLNAP